MTNSWTYPISGEIAKFPEGGEASVDTELHYFTKSVGGYSVSGVLRSMALFIDGLSNNSSVEAVFIYPEYREYASETTWAGMVAVYHDRPYPIAMAA